MERAQEFDDSYYLSLTPAERLETVQFLREEYWKLNKDIRHEGGRTLRRVIKIIKPAYRQMLHQMSNRPSDKVDIELLEKTR